MVNKIDDKESDLSVGDQGSILGSGRSLEEENGNPLQYSCLSIPPPKHRLKEVPDFPGGSDSKVSVYSEGDSPGFEPWVGKSPWRRK